MAGTMKNRNVKTNMNKNYEVIMMTSVILV